MTGYVSSNQTVAYYPTGTDIYRRWTTDGTTAATCASTWNYWTEEGVTLDSGMDLGTGDSQTVWMRWASTTATASVTTQDVYQSWTSGHYVIAPTLVRGRTPEEEAAHAAVLAAGRAQQDAVNARYQAAVTEQQHKRNAAKQKAEALLLANLSEEQQVAWREHRAIFVTGQSGKKYRIKDGRTHNIHELDEAGVPIREFCVHIGLQCPDADNVLAQKLYLEHNEEAMLRIANKWELVGGRRAA